MEILLGVIIGIVLTIVTIAIVEAIRSKTDSARLAFNLSKQNIEQQFKLKKDAQEKEMTQEIQERINYLKNSQKTLEESQAAAQLFYDKKVEELKDNFAQQQQELQKNYQIKEKQLQELYNKRQNDYESQESCARLERQNKIQEEISNEIKKKDFQLIELQKEFDQKKQSLSQDFLAYSEQISLKKENLDKEIQEYENKQQQLIARFQEDERVKNERDYYKIKITSAAAQDIQKLKTLALSFNNTNAIYKLIYEVYYKAQIEALFKKVLGQNCDKGGIYKITDITTEKIYIGRAVKFLDRWRTHAKRGCGIEPIKSLLYDRMMEIGLENFTFEVVEICSKEEQSEKEKYWINFYHSDSYGFNQNKGG